MPSMWKDLSLDLLVSISNLTFAKVEGERVEIRTAQFQSEANKARCRVMAVEAR